MEDVPTEVLEERIETARTESRMGDALLGANYKADIEGLKADIARWGIAVIVAVVAVVGAGVAILRDERPQAPASVNIYYPPTAQPPVKPIVGGE